MDPRKLFPHYVAAYEWASQWYYERRGWIAFAIVVLFAGVGLLRVETLANQAQQTADDTSAAFAQVKQERSDRIDALSSINAFFCQQNNKQDRILGQLVGVALATYPPPQTQEQVRGLRVFRDIYQRLGDSTNCRKLALALAKISGTDPNDVTIAPLRGVVIPGRNKPIHRDSKAPPPPTPEG